MQYEIIVKGDNSEVFFTITVEDNKELGEYISKFVTREILAITAK